MLVSWFTVVSRPESECEATMTNATTLNEHGEDRPLADSELDAVTGGTERQDSGSFFVALAHAWGEALDKKATSVE
jgi:hypothetical protein